MLEGKICLVTGAGSGIGAAAATLMAARGAEAVVLADVSEERCAQVADQVQAHGATALIQRCDVTDATNIQAVMDTVLSHYGRLDVLHNNAGIVETQFTDQVTIDTLPEDVWDKVFAVNVKGVWLCTKLAAPLLRASGRSAIVNTASIAGFNAYPSEAAYCASKAAVIQLTRSTAMDLAPAGIRCNCCCPAAIATPMLDDYFSSGPDREALERELTSPQLITRVGTAEDVAKLVCFLASDDASFITGAAYLIDGGALAWRGMR